MPSRPASAAVSDYQDPYLLDHGTAVDSKTPRSTLPRYGQDIVTKEFIDNHQEPAPTMYGMGEPEFGSFSRYGDPYSSSSSFPP
uniref:Uncharacterized protein n=1 Tax=Solanum lycopersicum TaxID=4081 RepID=A0A3Q7ILL1_SOLLC